MSLAQVVNSIIAKVNDPNLSESLKKDNDDISIAKLQDLLAALEKESTACTSALKELKRINEDKVKEYEAERMKVEKEYRPLMKEWARLRLYGNEQERLIEILSKEISQLQIDIEEGEGGGSLQEAYSKYLQDWAFKQIVQVTANSELVECEYQKEFTLAGGKTGEGEGGDQALISMIISNKTKKVIQLMIELNEKHSLSDSTCSSLCVAYAELIKSSCDASSSSCSTDKSALIFNDLRLISNLFMKDSSDKMRISSIGFNVLQSSLDNLLNDLSTVLTDLLRITSLNEATCLQKLEELADQCIVDIQKYSQHWYRILDFKVAIDLISVAIDHVLSAIFQHVISLKNITLTPEGRKLFPVTLSKVASIFDETIKTEHGAMVKRSLIGSVEMIDTFIAISQRNLIQVSNSFRRGEYSRIFSLSHFYDIVRLIFPDTAMKTAFLAEIESEM